MTYLALIPLVLFTVTGFSSDNSLPSHESTETLKAQPSLGLTVYYLVVKLIGNQPRPEETHISPTDNHFIATHTDLVNLIRHASIEINSPRFRDGLLKIPIHPKDKEEYREMMRELPLETLYWIKDRFSWYYQSLTETKPARSKRLIRKFCCGFLPSRFCNALANPEVSHNGNDIRQPPEDIQEILDYWLVESYPYDVTDSTFEENSQPCSPATPPPELADGESGPPLSKDSSDNPANEASQPLLTDPPDNSDKLETTV